VVPEKAELAGTLRCFDEDLRNRRHKEITDVCTEIAAKHGASVDVNILRGYPVLTNNEPLTETAKSIAKDYLGTENVHDLPVRMGAEDFAFYSQLVPACFYRIGVANKAAGITSAIHTPTFDIDERALLISMGLTASIAVNRLSAK
jgi:hippurate hydrolase